MKKSLLVLVSVSLLAAGCIKTQPVTSVPSNNTNTAKKDSPSTTTKTNSGFIQTNKTPQAKHNTSKWKVYQDKNISFKYPGDWRVEVQKEYDTVILNLFDSKKEYIIKEAHYEDTNIPPIGITYNHDREADTLAYYKERRDDDTGEKILQQETMLIGGKQAYIEYGVRKYESRGYVIHKTFFNTRIVFTNDLAFYFGSAGRDLAYHGYDIKVAQQIDDIFETMLSTVNFPAGK